LDLFHLSYRDNLACSVLNKLFELYTYTPIICVTNIRPTGTSFYFSYPRKGGLHLWVLPVSILTPFGYEVWEVIIAPMVKSSQSIPNYCPVVAIQSQDPYVPFPVQTLARLRSAGSTRRRSFVFTPPDSPTRSFTGELVCTAGDCRQPPVRSGPPRSVPQILRIIPLHRMGVSFRGILRA
jgi:hypothetical protein